MNARIAALSKRRLSVRVSRRPYSHSRSAINPILTFETKNLRESSELCREQWFRDDVARLKSHGVSLWDGKTALKTRYASEAEKVAFLEATGEAPSDDEIILVYLIELDVSTLKTP